MIDVPNRPEYQSELFKRGFEVCRDVLGGDYVDGSLARAGADRGIPAALEAFTIATEVFEDIDAAAQG